MRKEDRGDFSSLIQLVCNVSEAFTTIVFLPDPSRRSLFLKSYYSLGNSVMEDAVIPFGQGLVGWVAENNSPVNVAPFKQDSRTLGFYSIAEDISSFLAVPFPVGDSTGVLCIDSKKHYSFTPHHQKILMGFADQFSRLVSKEKKGADELELQRRDLETDLLYQICQKIFFEKRKINILDTISHLPRELLRFDGCAVSILSDDNKKFFILRSSGYEGFDVNFLKVDPHASLVGLVLKKNQIVHYPEVKKEYRKIFIFQPNEPDFPVGSFVGAPLRSGDQVIGVWSFTGKGPSFFNPRQIKLISILSLLIASALARPKENPVTI